MKQPVQEPHYAELAARALREEASGVSATPSSFGDRAASVAAIEQALRARGRRRAGLWLGGAAAVAAVAVLGLVALRPARHHAVLSAVSVLRQEPRTEPGATAAGTVWPSGRSDPAAWLRVTWSQGAEVVTDGGAPRRAATGELIVAGARLRAPADGRLILSSPTGTELRLGRASALRVESLGLTQKLRLEGGQVHAAVAKLLSGERFLIETADAEVEVRGTRFEVAIAGRARCLGEPRTRVTVEEGVVVVRAGGREARVGAGETWPSCPGRQEGSPAPSSRERIHSAKARTRGTTDVPATTAPDSSLAVQNDLFGAALSASRRGETREALYWLRRLLDRYPDGALAASARAEEQRLVQAAGPQHDAP